MSRETKANWFNLGADQIGTLHTAVAPLLCYGETFVLTEASTSHKDASLFWALGNRGTTVLARLTDKGWIVRRLP